MAMDVVQVREDAISDSVTVRVRSAVACMGSVDRRLSLILRELAGDQSPDVRATAIWALGCAVRDSQQEFQDIHHLLERESPQIQALVLDGLRASTDQEIEGLPVGASLSTKCVGLSVRIRVLQIELARAPALPPVTMPVIVYCLMAADRSLRVQGLRTIGMMGSSSTSLLPIVRRMASDPDYLVRLATVMALRSMMQPIRDRLAQELATFLTDENELVRSTTQRVLDAERRKS